jgi:hypothetical protein
MRFVLPGIGLDKREEFIIVDGLILGRTICE